MLDYIKQDFESHRLRAIMELLGMLCALGVAILLAATTPNPPMLPAYIGWNCASILLGVCSWHRGSFGLAVTYAGFLIIDTYGLLHTLGAI
jgi:hypothetical protein